MIRLKLRSVTGLLFGIAAIPCMASRVRRLIAAAVLCVSFLPAAPASAGAFHLSGLFPPSPVTPAMPAFEVFANLTDPAYPPNPVFIDLGNPTLPTLNIADIQNRVVFDFGMIVPGGLAVTFFPPQPVRSDSTSALLLHTEAHFGDTFFDVYFNAYFTVNEAHVGPFSVAYPPTPVYPPGPVFPNGSLQLDFAALSDPPFAVEISVFDQNGDRATFTDATVPEPGSLLLWGLGVTVVGAWRSVRQFRSRGTTI